MTIAYLNTEYPSLSHTFIEREVRALRVLGVRVQTYSVRPAAPSGTLSAEHRSAAESTVVLHRGVMALASGMIRACVKSPRAALRVIRAAVGLAPAGLKSKMLHLAYAAEGVALARDMQGRGIRHVHVHMANNGAAVALLACRFDPRLSYSLSIHGSAEFFHVDTWTLASKVESATFTRCISNFCRAQVMAWTNPVCWPKQHIVHCGIEVERFQFRQRSPSARLKLLTVGRLHSIKGYPLLLRACKALSEQGIDWSLDMVGDGPLRAALERDAASLGIADRVTFSGAVGQDAIQEHYEAADVLVVTSFMEGVPVVMMEAMAKGCLVAGSAVGGIPDLLEGGRCGVLISPGSEEEIARALAAIARGEHDQCSMRDRARARIETDFNINRSAVRMLAIFKSYGLIDGTPPSESSVRGMPTPREVSPEQVGMTSNRD